MTIIQILGALEMGLIYSLVAIGVYLSFRVLQFPDMTVDGSFPLGAAVTAAAITSGVFPAVATLMAVLTGMAAGLMTAWLSTHLRMLNLLAGIIMMTALYSFNLRIMGKPNIALLGEETLFTGVLENISVLIPLGVICLFTLVAIYRFLKSHMGLAIRATGNNAKMARAQGVNDERMIWLGLAIANGCVALAGSLFAQINGFADVTLGVGTIIIGLAAVIIGEAILPTRTVLQALIACVVGALIYRLLIAQALNVSDIGLKASDLNLVTAVLVAGAMLLPNLTKLIKRKRS